MRFAVLLSFLFALVVPASAQETGSAVLEDLETMEELLQQTEEWDAALEADVEHRTAASLFPQTDTEDVGEEVTGEQISDTYVSLRMHGVPVILDDVPLTAWFAPYVRDMAERGIISGYKNADGSAMGKYGPADSVTIEQLAKIAVEAADVDQSKCPSAPLNARAEGWAAPYISCAEYLRWTVYSDGSVNPKRAANRTEVVATILQAFSRPFEPATGNVFTDVSNTMPLRDAIETAAKDGIVSGYTDESGNPTGRFGPFDSVNRAETAKVVSLALQVY